MSAVPGMIDDLSFTVYTKGYDRKSKTELDAAAFYVSANRFTLLVFRASRNAADTKRDKDDGEHNAPGG